MSDGAKVLRTSPWIWVIVSGETFLAEVSNVRMRWARNP